MGKKRVQQPGKKEDKKQQVEGEEEEEEVAADRRDVWEPVDVNNDDNIFVKYFGPQGISICTLVGREAGEWDQMLAKLKTPLPSTFRVSPCGNFEKRTNRSLNLLVKKITETTTYPVLDETKGGEVIATGPPHLLGEWCPGAWSSGTFRSGLKQDGALKELHQFLVRASDTGAVSRQELVSMIPALLLDVQPGNRVLDMCAAPGSKSLQILEALGTSGVLVANDVDAKRAYLLVKRASAVKSAGLVVSTHDASQFPIQKTDDHKQFFNRVLCDVPCSGSGTMRKNLNLFRTLKVRDGLGLHNLQVRIASRGVYCLANQGVIVYSTCSFCPVENEAVVCELLRLFQGEIELVDCSKMLPGLKRAPGLSQPWKVPLLVNNNELKFFASMNEFSEWNVKQEKQLKQDTFTQSMFPPSNLSELNVDRCMRLLPHDQDSGGFFVAVFRKVRDIGEEKRQAKNEEELKKAQEEAAEALAKRNQPIKRNRHDVWYEEISDSVYAGIQSDWGITEMPKASFQVRKGGGGNLEAPADGGAFPTKISFLNPQVLELFALNSKPLHIVHAGVLAFQRSKGGKTYRVVNDYAALLLPYLTKRVITITFRDVKAMLDQLEHDSKCDPNVMVRNLAPTETAYLETLAEGGLVMKLGDEEQAKYEEEIGGRFAMSAWFGGKTMIRVMVDRQELLELLHQLKEVNLI
ncbi:hypothetical protein BASA81_000466 [Batrachochytrium salamandrivorans]|nr:hypothetical protein BASA81_000466 [Batrachochytrium salamandrivorans]